MRGMKKWLKHESKRNWTLEEQLKNMGQGTAKEAPTTAEVRAWVGLGLEPWACELFGNEGTERLR